MAGMPWIKLYPEMLDDVKISRLTADQYKLMIQLFLLAGECDAGGALVTSESRMTLDDVTWRLRSTSQNIKNDIDALVTAGILTIENDIIIVKNFLKRNGPTQEIKREQWQKRQKAHRERVKDEIVTRDTPVTPANVTLQEEEEEEEEEEAPTTPFSKLSAYVANAIQLAELTGGPAKWCEAIKTIEKQKPEESDIDTAVKYMTENGFSIAGPWSIINPVSIAISQRKRGAKSKPKKVDPAKNHPPAINRTGVDIEQASI